MKMFSKKILRRNFLQKLRSKESGENNKEFQNQDYMLLLEYSNNLKLSEKIGILENIQLNNFNNLNKIILYRYLFQKKEYFLFLITMLNILMKFILYVYTFKILWKIKKNQENNNNYKIEEEKNNEIKFKDIIGIDEFKEELEDIVNYMSNRKKFLKSGAIIPKGVLLIGPPGCGKTLLAKAVAGETNLSFYQVTASDFIQPVVGKGSLIIQKLFEQARNKKGAIIFIDEIDSLATRNEMFGNMNSNINQLLTEMDGFKDADNILIIAATNREKALDKALTRSGRFDLKIRIRLPVFENRKKLLKFYINQVKYDKEIDQDKIARKTVGFSPAEIKNLVNIAIMSSIKKKKFIADDEDFNDAFERIKLGVKTKNFLKDEKLKNTIALKEATKAVIAHFEEKLPDVDKISILSFGVNLGKSILIEKNDITNYTKEELLLRIEYLLASKAMEEVFLQKDDFTSFSREDVKNALNLATRFVTVLGMEEDFSLVSIEKKYLSEKMKRDVEIKAKEIINSSYDSILKKIQDKKEMIEKVKKVLIEKEEIDAMEFWNLLSKN